MVAVVLLFSAPSSREEEGRQQRIRRIADEFGLRVQGQKLLVGSFDDVGVRVRDDGDGTVVGSTLLSEPPPGLIVRSEIGAVAVAHALGVKGLSLDHPLDPKLYIRGDFPAEVRELLTQPSLLSCLSELIDAGSQVNLEEGTLEVRSPHGAYLDSLGESLRRATQLARALDQAGDGMWRQAASMYHLSGDATHKLRGTVDGFPVRVQLQHADKPERKTVLSTSFSHLLPADTMIKHASYAVGRAELGDPVLNALLSVKTSDPDALAARICSEHVRGALLEVVHGYEGSFVTATEIHLISPGRLLQRLPHALDSVVALARALNSFDPAT